MKDWANLPSQRIGTLSPGEDGHPRYFRNFLRRTVGSRFKPAIVSDSFETLRAAAVHGGVVSILPVRVARRDPSELVEVVPPGGIDRDGGI